MTETTNETPLTQNQADGIYENMKVLAEDQMLTEGKVSSLERNQKILAVGVILSIGGSVVLFKAVGNLTKGMTQLAQIIGAIPNRAQPPGPIPQPPVQDSAPHPPSSGARVVVEPRAPSIDPDTINQSSEGWDPGPQELPPEMRAAVEADNVTQLVLADEAGGTDLDSLIASEPVEPVNSDRVRHNAQGPR